MNLKDRKDEDLWNLYETHRRSRYEHTDLIDHLIPNTHPSSQRHGSGRRFQVLKI